MFLVELGKQLLDRKSVRVVEVEHLLVKADLSEELGKLALHDAFLDILWLVERLDLLSEDVKLLIAVFLRYILAIKIHRILCTDLKSALECKILECFIFEDLSLVCVELYQDTDFSFTVDVCGN